MHKRRHIILLLSFFLPSDAGVGGSFTTLVSVSPYVVDTLVISIFDATSCILGFTIVFDDGIH